VKKGSIFRILSGFLLFNILAVVLAACAPSTGEDGSGSASIPNRRNMNPVSPSEDMKELVGGNNAFAFDYYQSVRDQGGNLFFSPFSISIALR